MNNFSGSTPDLLAELRERLIELVPGAFPDGVLDVRALAAAIGEDDVGDGFVFSWPGIDRARNDARAPTSGRLNPDPDASVGWKDSSDILIEGDNLQVLKLLQRGYGQKVKLIYIDPPYNTGETFTYRDDFAIPERTYLRSSGQVDTQGGLLTSKVEKGGRKHAPWLTMMMPRLVAARLLLRRDGLIMVSIDNNEVHHLRLLLDATFGAMNFVDMITWQGGRKGDARLTAGGQDYILVYARDLAYLKSLNTRWRERKTGLELVYTTERRLLDEHGDDHAAATEALRAWFENLPDAAPAKQHCHYNNIDAGGVWTSDNSSSPNPRDNLRYDFKGYSPPDNGWRYELATMEQLDAAGKLIYPTGRAKRIRIKKYLHDQEYWAPASSFYRDRSGASSQLEGLMDAAVFDNPKSVDVLARLIGGTTRGDDLVLDFFAGSGTTGQAVWEQNRADGQRRRWVLVQAPEPPQEDEPSGQAALDAGYDTIFEITAERLRRVADRMNDAGPSAGIGFRIFRSAPTLLNFDHPVPLTGAVDADQYVLLCAEAANRPAIVAGAAPSEVAWEVLIKATGAELDQRMSKRKLGKSVVYEFQPRTANGGAKAKADARRVFVCLDKLSLLQFDELDMNDRDLLVLRSDRLADGDAITLASRLNSRLLLIERVTHEVSI